MNVLLVIVNSQIRNKMTALKKTVVDSVDKLARRESAVAVLTIPHYFVSVQY